MTRQDIAQLLSPNKVLEGACVIHLLNLGENRDILPPERSSIFMFHINSCYPHWYSLFEFLMWYLKMSTFNIRVFAVSWEQGLSLNSVSHLLAGKLGNFSPCSFIICEKENDGMLPSEACCAGQWVGCITALGTGTTAKQGFMWHYSCSYRHCFLFFWIKLIGTQSCPFISSIASL